MPCCDDVSVLAFIDDDDDFCGVIFGNLIDGECFFGGVALPFTQRDEICDGVGVVDGFTSVFAGGNALRMIFGGYEGSDFMRACLIEFGQCDGNAVFAIICDFDIFQWIGLCFFDGAVCLAAV